MPESNGSLPSPENSSDSDNQISVYLGRVGASKMVEVKGITKLMSPEGYVGLPASSIGKIAVGATPNTVIWIKVADNLAHAEQQDEQALKFVNGELVVDPNMQALKVNGADIDLSQKEFQVFEYLAKKAGKTVSREELIHAIWGGYVQPQTPSIHISNIRSKLNDYSWILRTKHRIGYVLDDNPENNPNNHSK